MTLAGAALPLVEALSDGVIAADELGTIVYANRSVARLLGWEPSDLVGRPVSTIIPARLREAHRAGFEHLVRTGEERIIGTPVRVPALTSTGDERSIELVLSRLPRSEGGLYAVATLRDISQRLDLERQTALVHHLLTLFGQPSDERDLVARVLATLTDALEVDEARLWEFDEGERRLHCVATHADSLDGDTSEGPPVVEWGEGQVGLAWATGSPSIAVGREASGHGSVAFPLIVGGTSVAVIEVVGPVDQIERPGLSETLETIGPHLGNLFLRHFNELAIAQAAERERSIATALQRNLLPAALPTIPGVAVGATFRPGGELVVGGDFYDVFEIPSPDGGRWGFAIGDVCGTGPEAAALTALVRHKARALLRVGIGLEETLGHINRAMLERGDDRFCTCIYGTLAISDARVELHLANAGHPGAVIHRARGEVVTVPGHGSLLGVLAELRCATATVVLEPGDALVLYTDGVTEARCGADQFGVDRLDAVIASLPGATSPDAIASAIRQAVEDHADARPRDDLAILVLQRTAPAASIDG